MNGIFHHDGRRLDVASSAWAGLIRQAGFKGVIFDCDGTLVDSAMAHFGALRDATLEQGQEMQLSWYEERSGFDRRGLFEAFAEEVGQGFDAEHAIPFSISCFPRHTGAIKPIPETIALFRELRDGDYPVAVATNSERDVARQSLAAVGLAKDVEVLVTVSDGLPPKPSPKMFQRAAERMGVAASDICVFEDSPQGVAAAKAAGMSVVVVTAAKASA